MLDNNIAGPIRKTGVEMASTVWTQCSGWLKLKVRRAGANL